MIRISPPLMARMTNKVTIFHTNFSSRAFWNNLVQLPVVPGNPFTAVLAFTHTVGEFGVVLMVGGNIPGVTRTVSIEIYDKVQALNYGGANATALVLLVISFAVLSLVYGLNRKVWSLWR